MLRQVQLDATTLIVLLQEMDLIKVPIHGFAPYPEQAEHLVAYRHSLHIHHQQPARREVLVKDRRSYHSRCQRLIPLSQFFWYGWSVLPYECTRLYQTWGLLDHIIEWLVAYSRMNVI